MARAAVQALLLLLSLCLHHVHGDTIYCDNASASCDGERLTCKSGEDCSILCGSTDSSERGCLNTIFTCASNYICSLDCSTDHTCDNITLHAANASELTVTSLAYESLNYSTIYCPVGGDVTITCGGNSCHHNIFDATFSAYVDFIANEGWAWTTSIIDASHADFLHVRSNGYGALSAAIIYCPDNGPKQANNLGTSCVVDTADNWFGGRNVKIYAKEGFNDVSLEGPGFTNILDVLFCGDTFQYSCDLIDINPSNPQKVICNTTTRNADLCETYLLPS